MLTRAALLRALAVAIPAARVLPALPASAVDPRLERAVALQGADRLLQALKRLDEREREASTAARSPLEEDDRRWWWLGEPTASGRMLLESELELCGGAYCMGYDVDGRIA